ncbi:MAG TPA: protein kinase, partial [Gemmataceae bacterium]
QLAASGAARQRFAREARAAAAVVHDNVIAIHAVAEAAGLPYIVMPFVRGPSLEARLRQTGAFGTDETLRVGLQIAHGLAAAHAQGLVHRDIKPANILLEGGVERVWITDFGLARAVDDASLTRSGVIAGTPQYMSPEQAAGDRVDHRSDLFSLGSVLYALCTGRPPFRAGTTLAVLRRVEEDRPRPVREINPDVPEWLARVVEKLMERDPADRFQTAAEVADLLEGYLAHRRQPGTVAAPELPPPPAAECVELRPAAPRRRWLIPAAAAALLAGLAIILAQVAAPPIVSTQAALSAGPPVKPVEFYQGFRGAGPLPAPFRPYATEGCTVVRDAEGLRIALPVRKSHNFAGVELPRRFVGDFEITAGYELLRADQPTTGHGVGFIVRLTTATARPSDVAFCRMTRVQEGDVYWASRMTTGEDGKPDYGVPDHTPATARSGSLRITRVGDEASFWVADDDSGEFRKLFQKHVGPEDVTSIVLAAYPGWEANPVEVRIRDLRVRGSTAAGPPPTSAPPSVVVAQDFRGGGGPAQPLQVFGQDAANLVRQEAGGLRITLPPGRRPSNPVGVVMGPGLRGDFDIAAGYELIRLDPPAPDGWGGFEVYIADDTPADNAIAFYRHVRAGKGDTYMYSRMKTVNGKRQYPSGFEPTAASAGRLRLTRRGGEVTLWAAEGQGEYRELQRCEFGPADLKFVRFAAHPGPKSNGVDLRITNVYIQDGPVSPATAEAAAAAAAPPR